MGTKQPSVKRDLILLVSVPLLLALLLALIVYVPQLLARPAHDFIYSSCSSYTCSESVYVRSGLVVREYQVNDEDTYSGIGQASLYYYDVAKQSSRAVSFEEAQAYTVDNSSRSSDGYVLIHESSSSGPFFSGSRAQWVLRNGMYRKQITLSESDYYGENIKFIGWVE